MARDIRKLFEQEQESDGQQMKAGHEKRFLERLENALPERRKPVAIWLQVAASVLVLLGIAGYYFLGSEDPDGDKVTVVEKSTNGQNEVGISLGDLSPDLKKIENYYEANINLEISNLAISDKNRALVDSYMDQLAELNREYKKLNKELNEIGPNDQTISAMIKNLQLRLHSMHKLKEKLNQLKSSKNDTVTEANI